jgi:Holliday junction resolvase
MSAYYTMPVTSGYGNSGVPDFMVCHRGKFIAIECKANGGKPTALQEEHLRQIRMAEGIALVIDESNVDYLAETLLQGTYDND